MESDKVKCIWTDKSGKNVTIIYPMNWATHFPWLWWVGEAALENTIQHFISFPF